MTLISFNWRPTRAQLRGFGLLWLPLFLGLVAALLTAKAVLVGVWMVLLPLGLLSVLLGAVAPGALRPVFVLLLAVTFPIGLVVSYVAMAVLFFIVLTPIALLLRRSGRAGLELRLDRGRDSYWIPHRGPQPVTQYFRQF